jgi:hypothetical protein
MNDLLYFNGHPLHLMVILYTWRLRIARLSTTTTKPLKQKATNG